MLASNYSIWNRFGIFVTVKGPFHFAINLLAFSWGRMAIITLSPTANGLPVANNRFKTFLRNVCFKIFPLFKIYLNHPVSSCKSQPASVTLADVIASINYVSCLLLTLNQTSSST